MKTRTREFDFLLAAVRDFFRPDSALCSSAPAGDGLDSGAILRLARQHGVVGFLPATVNSPAAADRTREAARSALALSAELARLADSFNRQGIGVVPLKGPVLGAALYQDRPVKSSTDLDLLVRRADALPAKRLLEGIGYRLETVPHWPSEKASLRNVNHELSFNDPGQWLKLDLHWSLLPAYFPAPFDESTLWAGVRTVPWGGAQLQTLPPELQLLFLCGHGAKHAWTRLAWICDLARLIQIERGMDWDRVFAQSRRSHTTRMVLLGLLLAHQVAGVDLPPAAASLVEADPRVRPLAAAAVERLRANRRATTVSTTAFCYGLLERPGQRARLVCGMFLQPTEAEYRLLQLPPALYWVYYLFRPLRLAAKYARRLAGG